MVVRNPTTTSGRTRMELHADSSELHGRESSVGSVPGRDLICHTASLHVYVHVNFRA